jgi:hypothetical protein
MARPIESKYPELANMQVIGAPPPRLFSPSEAHRLSGVKAESQRMWRSRGLISEFLQAPFDFVQVTKLALIGHLSDRGVEIATAHQIAEAVNQQLYMFDFASQDEPPLFVFWRPVDGGVAVSTHAGKIEFDTAHPWWGGFGAWLNYSEIQRSVLAAYDALVAAEAAKANVKGVKRRA